MLNFQPELVDDRALQVNQHAIERHVNDDHYVRYLSPGHFVLGTGSAHTTITAAAPQWPAVEFPDAADTWADASWLKPSEWRSGMVRFKFWYTSPVGSTNNFDVLIRIRALSTNEVVPGTLLYSATVGYAGPAVANTLLNSGYVYTTTALGGDDEMFSFQLVRGGVGDANNNALHLVMVRVEHIPAQQVSQ